MKRITKYIALLLPVAALTVSCFADLEIKPKDTDSPDTYFKDSTTCASAWIGCYDALSRHNENLFNGYTESLFVYWNITDEMYLAGGGTGPKVYVYNSTYAANRSMYRQLYAAIQRCSQFLKYMEGASLSTNARQMMEGEVRFIRAYCYFTLVQNWGRVPLVTEAVESVNNPYMEQSDEAVIYDWVISEMTAAEKLVKPIDYWGYGGHVNKSAVRAILARVCLFKAGFPCYDQSKYEEAYKWAKMVIDDPVHELIPNYADVFIPLVQDKYDIRENIWEIEGYFADKTDGRTEYLPSLSVNLGTQSGNETANVCFQISCAMNVHKGMFKKYEQDQDAWLGSPDERRNWSIAPFTNAAAALDGATRLVFTYFNYSTTSNDVVLYTRQCNKFNRQYATIWPAFQSNTGTNLCMVRYGDVLLMAAEALCKWKNSVPQEAIDYVNLIRKRAYGQLDNRHFIERIDVTAGGTGYAADKVVVEVIDKDDNSKSITCTTSNTAVAKAYREGHVKGPITIASATVTSGAVSAIVLRDRGHAYKTTPEVKVRVLTGAAAPGNTGSGATAVAVMKTVDPDYLLPASATASPEAFMQTIMDERARELCFEGWRRVDLKRWNKLVEVVEQSANDGRNAIGLSAVQVDYVTTPGNNIKPAHMYLPIPAAEIMLNRELEQNEGW